MGSHDNSPLKILFAASEAQPLIKTGGLADVAGSLPVALSHFGHDVRVILPAYPQAVERAIPLKEVASLKLTGSAHVVRVLEGRLLDNIPLYLVDAPDHFNRPGNPYVDASGNDWSDNPERFALFARAIVSIALNHAGLQWKPDVVHCNDWQTGLVPPLLASDWNRPATVFTIHNLAYQGLYDRATFTRLQLPSSLWSYKGLEFHQYFSFIKGGIAFSDCITTVSPTYAKEILTSDFGYGLEGLLAHRHERLSGILNGIDYTVWDPTSDPCLVQHFDHNTFRLKRINKLRLQEQLGLPVDEHATLFGHIGRLVEQKGVDLILDVLPGLLSKPDTQVVILGSGNTLLEQRLRETAERHADQVAVYIGYDETLAHRIEAACDCFIMPSRFEPCGLNQLYSLRYGAVPIVKRTGGLADTVVDASSKNLLDGVATGFCFTEPTAYALWQCLERVFELRSRPPVWWEKLAITGMQQNFSWDVSAGHYLEVYRKAMNEPAANPVKM